MMRPKVILLSFGRRYYGYPKLTGCGHRPNVVNRSFAPNGPIQVARFSIPLHFYTRALGNSRIVLTSMVFLIIMEVTFNLDKNLSDI